MIFTKTPYRISFFGGGTDYPNWYLNEGGQVLSTTIDKYCYISARVLPPFFENKHRIVWSHIETVRSISEILHPAVREGLRMLGFGDDVGLEIHYQGDLPARAGMGSSSSFSVGLIRALMGLRGQIVDRHELAMQAIRLEQEVLRENVGSQDQVAAAYGGFNVIRFSKSGEILTEPVTIRPRRLEELQSQLMLFYTGTSRLSSEIAKQVIDNLSNKKKALNRMRDMVKDALGILAGNTDLKAFGELMHEGWMLKSSLSSAVSNPKIDQIYNIARDHGAIGGKLLGAGSTGFMLFFVPKEMQPVVREVLGHLLHVPFRFETQGSHILNYTPDYTLEFLNQSNMTFEKLPITTISPELTKKKDPAGVSD